MRVELEIGRREEGLEVWKETVQTLLREATFEVVKSMTFRDRFEFKSQFCYLLIVVI